MDKRRFHNYQLLKVKDYGTKTVLDLSSFYKTKIEGKGGEKYDAKRGADSVLKNNAKRPMLNNSRNYINREFLDNSANAVFNTVDYLAFHYRNISKFDKEVLMTNYLFGDYHAFFYNLVHGDFKDKIESKVKFNNQSYLQKFQEFETQYIGQIADNVLIRSINFWAYAEYEAIAEVCIRNKVPFFIGSEGFDGHKVSLDEVIDVLNARYHGLLRDKLILNALSGDLQSQNYANTWVLMDESIFDKTIRNQARRLLNTRRIGSPVTILIYLIHQVDTILLLN